MTLFWVQFLNQPLKNVRLVVLDIVDILVFIVFIVAIVLLAEL